MRGQVHEEGFHDGAGAGVYFQDRQGALRVGLRQADLLAGETVAEKRFRDAAGERDHHRLVVLVAVVVNHYHNFAQAGEDFEEGHAVDQDRVLQGDVGRQQRFRDAAVLIHRVEAHAAGEVADEVEPVADELRTEEEPRGKQGFNFEGGHHTPLLEWVKVCGGRASPGWSVSRG